MTKKKAPNKAAQSQKLQIFVFCSEHREHLYELDAASSTEGKVILVVKPCPFCANVVK